MITLEVTCSQCGKRFPKEIQTSTVHEMSHEAVAAQLKFHGWIVQINGENFDPYCSKKCAE